MRLIIVRHGETFDNVSKTVQGQTHGKLTKRGVLQAKLAGERLKGEKIDIFYSSDLGRAIETLVEIARHHNYRKIVLSEKLRERNLGEFHGRPASEYHKAFEASGKDKDKYSPAGGGESHSDVRKRIVSFVKSLPKKHNGKTVLAVTHGGPIMNLFKGLFSEEVKAGNASISVIEFKGGKFRKVSADERAHLRKSARKRENAAWN